MPTATVCGWLLFIPQLLLISIDMLEPRREADEKPAIDTFWKVVRFNQSLSEVSAVELPILRGSKRDHHAPSSSPLCGTECIIVFKILLCAS
jgi:hypothetical protein